MSNGCRLSAGFYHEWVSAISTRVARSRLKLLWPPDSLLLPSQRYVCYTTVIVFASQFAQRLYSWRLLSSDRYIALRTWLSHCWQHERQLLCDQTLATLHQAFVEGRLSSGHWPYFQELQALQAEGYYDRLLAVLYLGRS